MRLPREAPVDCAAIREVDGTVHSLPRPARHADVAQKMVALGKDPDAPGVERGFLLVDGKWARRTPAARIAQEHGQLVKPLLAPPSLLSEDLW